MQIDRRIYTGGEIGRSATAGIKDANPAAAKVGEKIFAGVTGGKLLDRRIVKSTADDGAAGGAAAAVSVLK